MIATKVFVSVRKGGLPSIPRFEHGWYISRANKTHNQFFGRKWDGRKPQSAYWSTTSTGRRASDTCDQQHTTRYRRQGYSSHLSDKQQKLQSPEHSARWWGIKSSSSTSWEVNNAVIRWQIYDLQQDSEIENVLFWLDILACYTTSWQVVGGWPLSPQCHTQLRSTTKATSLPAVKLKAILRLATNSRTGWIDWSSLLRFPAPWVQHMVVPHCISSFGIQLQHTKCRRPYTTCTNSGLWQEDYWLPRAWKPCGVCLGVRIWRGTAYLFLVDGTEATTSHELAFEFGIIEEILVSIELSR